METIKKIIRDVNEIGGRAFIVGGYVRDMVLGRESKDIDVEVFGISGEQLRNVLERYGRVALCGKSFGVYKLGNFDFALPRRERKNGVGHKGFEISVDPHMSFEDACRRRDLTINSMLFCPLKNEIVDPFSGLRDLRNGVIRHIDDATFAEDPLRVMRVAQFSARFEFSVDGKTRELCAKLLNELKCLSRERFLAELEKILLKAGKPSIAFRFMLDTGVLHEIFPELARLAGVEQGRKHHPEGNVFEHTMLAIDSVPLEERRLDLMLAVLTHDMGKAVVETGVEQDGEIVHFYGHAEEGVSVVRDFLARFTNEKDLTESVVSLVQHHMLPYQIKDDITRKAIRRLALKVNIDDLMVVHLADLKGRAVERDTSHIERIISVYRYVQSEIKPLIQGRHLIELGMKPSSRFGILLKEVFEAQLDGKFSNVEGGLAYVKRLIEAGKTSATVQQQSLNYNKHDR